MAQNVLEADGEYRLLDSWFAGAKCVMLVCGRSICRQRIDEYLKAVPARLGVKIVRFSDFVPNPQYESVVKGVELFRVEGCDAIVAVGGGSAMDVAKCIKLYSSLPGDGARGDWLTRPIVPNAIPFLAVPTTAGTGSEATRFAVIYYGGKKQSVSDRSCIPDTVLLDSGMLATLPLYQKKATMMDALCHAVEAFWSVNSTEESKEFSRIAIRGVLENMDGYLTGIGRNLSGMLHAAHTAGRAIDIAQTTAGHAMCYKITGFFGCAHGHAAALCDRILFPWMIGNTGKCSDPRGEAYLKKTLDELGRALGGMDGESGAKILTAVFDKLELAIPAATDAQYEELKTSVNASRLKNHPIALDEAAIDKLYHDILR